MRAGSQSGSFRDPTSRVFEQDGRLLRALSAEGLKSWEAVRDSKLLREEALRDSIVPTHEVDDGEVALDPPWVALLEHERMPFVSYPYEWPFGMLHDAASLHLDLMAEALEEGLVLKDASPFNIQWRGTRPVFIDLGSVRPLRDGEPWPGYRQFCSLFLYPLMLQAYRSVAFQPWLRGSLDGISASDMRRLLGLRDWLRPGVLTHVVLHDRLDRRTRDKTSGEAAAELRAAGFSAELIKANVARLRRLLRRLRWRPRDSAWSAYREQQPYTDAARDEKARFVEMAGDATAPRLVWDLGANDGRQSRILADRGAFVVAMDSDHGVVEQLYRDLRERDDDRILPLVMNLAAPSPDLGWRGSERLSLQHRGRPDLVLCLALIHHLAISASVPLPEIVGWLASLRARAVIEWVEPEDPMVQRLLRSKPDEDRHEYGLAAFERHLREWFVVEEEQRLAGGTRVLVLARPREG